MAEDLDTRPTGSVETFDLRRGPVEPFAVEGIRFVRYHARLAPALAAAMGVGVETVHRRQAEAMQASVALLEDDLVAAYGWVSHELIRIYELNLAVPIPRGHAYIWDCTTLYPYRNRGIFAGLLRFILEDLRLQGDTRAWGAVAPGNEPSLRAFSRAGFRLVARLHADLGRFDLAPTDEATADELAFVQAMRPIFES